MMLLTATAAALIIGMPQKAPAKGLTDETAGCLQIVTDGKPVVCPLMGTKVEADIVGFGARVTVRQTFANPTDRAIEAVYTFPLPSDAAVDRMRMKIGDRIIEGSIKRKEEARRIYEEAKNRGQVASLLDQARPNIFTQSVANIMPGAKVDIEISYVETLKFEKGEFEFSYPMVVGHRYTGQGTNDSEKITPPITPKGTRTGAGIELKVNIDAGMRIEEINSKLHAINLQKRDANRATISLAKRDEIPNRDFILRYRVAGTQMKSAFLSYADPKNGGFFTLILMPPRAPQSSQIAPKEVLFVIDQSGSQNGFPIEKSRELSKKMIEALNPNDTFNVLGFNTKVNYLWSEPRKFSEANKMEAWAFINGLQANGGTHLIDAVRGALSPKADPDRRRLVVFNTDGYIGNDFEVLAEIAKHRCNTRMFTFGIGNSVNRFLIEGMSREGRGDAEFVTLSDNADAAVARFIERTRYPVLLDVEAKFEGVQVADVLPKVIPDVFGDHPIILKGRYLAPGSGRIVLSGKLGGDQDWVQTINLNLPDLPGGTFSLDTGLQANAGDPDPVDIPDVENAEAPLRKGSAIATLWARAMVDEIARQDYLAVQRGDSKSTVAANITRLGLSFGIMTQFTSFVAVENRVVNLDGKPRTIRVPVEMADGVSYEGIFGARERESNARKSLGAPPMTAGGFGGGFAGTTSKANADALRFSPAPASWEEIAKLSDDEIAKLRGRLDSKSEEAMLAGASSEFKARYLYLTRVATSLRNSKNASFAVRVILSKVTDDTKKALETAGLKLASFDGSLKFAAGSCKKEALSRLCQVAGVQHIDPL